LALATPHGVAVWDHRTGELIHVIERDAPVGYVCVALSPDGTLLAHSFGATRPELHLVRLDSPGDEVSFTLRTTAPISCLAYSHDGLFLAAGTGCREFLSSFCGGEIIVIDVAKRSIATEIDIQERRLGNIGVSSISFHPGDPSHSTKRTFTVAPNCHPPVFLSYTVDGDWRVTSFQGRSSEIATAIAFSDDGYGQARGHLDGQVYVEDVCPQDP